MSAQRMFLTPQPPDLGARAGEVEELQAVIGDPLIGEAARRGAQERLKQIAHAENAAAAHERAVAQCQGRPCSCGEHPPAVRATSSARQVERACLTPSGEVIALNSPPGETRFLAPVPYHEAQQDGPDELAALKVEAHDLRALIDNPRTPWAERQRAEARLRTVEQTLAEAARDPASNPGAHAQQVATCTGAGSRLAVNATRTSRTTLPCATCGEYHGTTRTSGERARPASPQQFVAPVAYWEQ